LLKLEHGLALVDLRVVAEEKAGNIVVECEYNEELFDGSTIEHLLEGYVSVLNQLTSDSPLQICDIALPQSLLEQAIAAGKRAQKQTVVITSTFTAEPVEPALAFWMNQLGIRAEVSFSP